MSQEPRPFETAQQIAALLQCSPATVKAMGRAGIIPRIVITSQLVRYDREAVLAAINAKREAAKENTK